jgi:hypothetical protein
MTNQVAAVLTVMLLAITLMAILMILHAFDHHAHD